MATLARLNDFTPGTVIVSQEVDDEFNQLVNLLNGTTTTLQTILQLDDNALSVLKLNQVKALSGSIIQEWQSNGVQRVKIDGLGRVHSTVVGDKTGTGNEPFIIASSKLCTQLNADLLDGLHASEIISGVLSDTVADQWIIQGASPELVFDDTDVGDVGDVKIELDTDGADQQLSFLRRSDLAKIMRMNLTNLGVQFHKVVVLRADNSDNIDITVSVGGSEPHQHLATKHYVDDRRTVWSIGSYYNGAITIGAKTAQFIAPDAPISVTITTLKILYETGLPLGDSTVDVSRNGSSIGAITLTSATPTNTVVRNSLSPIVLSQDDRLTFTVTAAGGHENVTVHVAGFQKLSNTWADFSATVP